MTTGTSTSAPAPPARILNVNDHDGARYVVTRVLKKAGFEVLEAATGRQALHVAATQAIDCIVLDVNLPDMDGYEVCRQLRGNPRTAAARILHVSAVRTKVPDRVQGLEGGADAYLVQPVDPAELVATVKSLLRASEAEKAARAEALTWQSTFDSITDAVALLDEHGVVVRCNRAFASLHRREFKDIVGRSSKELSAAADGQVGGRTFRQMKHDAQKGVLEVEVEGQWFRVTEHPVFDADGAVTGAVQIFANITDAKRAMESLIESEERFRLLVGAVREYAIFMLDPQGRVASWNGGAERIMGYQSLEILGHHVAAFYLPDDLKRGAPATELEAASIRGQSQTEGWRVKNGGARFWAEVFTTAVRDENDILRGFAVVTRDATERKRMVEELQHRAQALAEASTRKDEFLAMLGHELRNPLGAIQTAAALLTQRGGADDKTTHLSETITRQTRHLKHLVDDLLDVSRITSGRIELRPEPVDLAAAIRTVTEEHRAMIDARRHALELALPSAPLVAEVDPLRFEQILSNLLSNATKYMEPGGALRVALEREPAYAVVRVRDRGIGIAEEMLPRIFDLFSQADASLARSYGGLGIGLTIVKNLVERHGGSVAAFSEGLGLGSEFVVRLPLPATTTPRVTPPPSGPRAAASNDKQARRILLVEDNVDLRDSLADLLDFWGHDVSAAPDGETGIRLAAEAAPEVMLVDVGLPGVSGYDVARKVRALPGGSDVYLVALTGYGSPEDKQRALEAGFNVHLVKPVHEDELARVLNDLWLTRRS